MTRSKCQNRELAIATVMTRNDLNNTWEEKMANSLCNGGDGREHLSASSNYYTVQTFKTSAFQSLWEFQTMTKDLWNVKSKSTNLNHTFSRFIESFSKNSYILFSLIQIDADIFHSTIVCFTKFFGLCSELSQDLGCYSLVY